MCRTGWPATERLVVGHLASGKSCTGKQPTLTMGSRLGEIPESVVITGRLAGLGGDVIKSEARAIGAMPTEKLADGTSAVGLVGRPVDGQRGRGDCHTVFAGLGSDQITTHHPRAR